MELESQQLLNTDARAQGVNDQSGYINGNIALKVREKELYTSEEYTVAIKNLLLNSCEYYVMQSVPTKTNGISEYIHTFIMTTFWKQGRLTIIFATCILFLFGLFIFIYCPIGNYTSILDYNIERKVLNITDFSIQDSSDAPIFYVNGTLQINIIDYVKPIKVKNVKLNSDDLLYESKRNNKDKDYISAYSVTGNFRSKSNQIWDPHPEYKLTAFGHQLHIVLHQDNSFITPNSFRVIRILDNTTEVQDGNDHYLGCYYKGYVRGDNKSAVAMSLCNGMTGHIKTSFGSLLIEPVENSTNAENVILHKVWRHSKRHSRYLTPANFDINEIGDNFSRKLIRKRRNYVDKHLYTMEVLVAVDKTMIEFHNDDLKSYILTLISIVSNIFSDASIGNSIYISVSNILILKDDIVTTSGKKSMAASQLLKHFCLFLRKKGIPYDTAIMLTRDQICRNESETKCDTLGLAELGTVCKRYSCSIVQDNGLPAAFTIAHELGHILNMPHDDDTRCNNFKQYGRNTLHIMSSTMGDDIHPWSWSDCSRHYVSEFLEKEDTTCLEDTPQTAVTSLNAKLPGEMYSLDQQCKLIHGNHSKNCSIEGECARLWCKAEPNRPDCRSSNLPWADGTPCGKKNHWCQKGKCTPREGTKRHVINGGWGPWSSFTACSMTCGGGVQESRRECNNPLPQNGGKYCGGSRKKYRSCNTQSCPAGSLESREQQCYDMNGNNFGLKGINGSVIWIPKYGLTGRDKCKLYCRIQSKSAYFQLADKVKDGTTCSFDSFDKCVNGICRPAGCDNELNSMATLDKCGVCEGRNNTCEEYTGNLYRSDLSNKTNSLYYYVTTIPKGSSNIVITQPNYHKQNYIVLRDADGNSLLNGDRVINTYKHTFFYAGLSFEYNGSESTIEQVNTTYSRKLKKDLIVQIISLNLETIKNDTVLLSYTYTSDKPHFVQKIDSYQWEARSWSPCNALCQGTSTQVVSCVNIESGLKVAPPFCDSTTKPKAASKLCNTNCHLTINVSSTSECSAQCGMMGRREKNLYCVQTFVDENRSNIVPLTKCETKFEISTVEQCSEGCWNYTNWSPCSMTCGNGRQERRVACYLNGTKVDDSLCNLRKRSSYSDTIRLCYQKPCTELVAYEETQYRSEHYWTTDNWSECDSNCEKTRSVNCTIGHKCAIEKKPIEKKKCCTIKYVATWSPCSVECGIGTRKKEFYCARVQKSGEKGFPRKKIQIDSKYCSSKRVPTPKRSKKSCKINCKWATENWSDCAPDCRSEYQTRNVHCVTGPKDRPISTKYCESSKKPLTKRMCSHCVRREIKYTKCNCEGFKRRRTICSDGYGKRITCPTKVKMIKEKCRPSDECLPRSCADIKRQRKNTIDQEYTIYVKKKPKKIFCHNMNNKPKEYITLNPSENYSIYYSNKTKYSDICPSDQRYIVHNDDCNRYGRTRFRRVGIDINTLRVNENDFTFAESVGTPQPFGSAGDCCNRNRECPQGDFSINISTTGFVIRFGTVWDMFGQKAIMKTSNGFEHSSTDKRAFCGGYCGRCAISSHTGLFLDV